MKQHTPEQMAKALAILEEGLTVNLDYDDNNGERFDYCCVEPRGAEFWGPLNERAKPQGKSWIVDLAAAWDALHPGEQPPYVVLSRQDASEAWAALKCYVYEHPPYWEGRAATEHIEIQLLKALGGASDA